MKLSKTIEPKFNEIDFCTTCRTDKDSCGCLEPTLEKWWEARIEEDEVQVTSEYDEEYFDSVGPTKEAAEARMKARLRACGWEVE